MDKWTSQNFSNKNHPNLLSDFHINNNFDKKLHKKLLFGFNAFVQKKYKCTFWLGT